VLWERRDTFDGESAAAVTVRIPWSQGGAHIEDAFGSARIEDAVNGTLRLAVTDTPLFITHGMR
jgi:hypothetical protein